MVFCWKSSHGHPCLHAFCFICLLLCYQCYRAIDYGPCNCHFSFQATFFTLRKTILQSCIFVNCLTNNNFNNIIHLRITGNNENKILAPKYKSI